jgi:mannose-6-phosphate isomerase
LRWWNQRAEDPAVEQAAQRLCDIGEAYGVNDVGITFDELWDDLTPRTATARTWPQTERLKACLAAAQLAEKPDERTRWQDLASQALHAFLPFLDTAVDGLWNDRLGTDGRPIIASAPTSTLYHLICALETCKSYLSQSER